MLTAASFAAVLLLTPAPAQTEAAWTDGESASATFTAMTLVAPSMTECTYSPALAGSSTISIKWRPPGNMTFQPGPNVDYRLDLEDSAGQLAGAVQITSFNTTGPAGGVYTSNVSFSAGNLNNRYRVTFRSKIGTQWLSATYSAARASYSGITARCAVSNPA